MKNNRGVTILMYHEIVADDDTVVRSSGIMHASYFVSVSLFRKQLECIKSLGLKVISLQEMLDTFVCLGELSPSVVITFDDGYEGNYKYALPILKEYGFKATFFIATGLIGKPYMMNMAQLQDMAKNGMSIQSHTHSHRFLKDLSVAEIGMELKDSKKILEDNLGVKVEFLSLPHGSYNASYKKVALQCGYRGGCCSFPGYNNIKIDKYLLRRWNILQSYTAFKMMAVLRKENIFLMPYYLRRILLFYLRALIGDKLYHRFYALCYRLKCGKV